VSLHFLPRLGRKVARHFAPETGPATAQETRFGLLPETTQRTVLGTVLTVVPRMSILTALMGPNTISVGHLGSAQAYLVTSVVLLGMCRHLSDLDGRESDFRRRSAKFLRPG
jgi:hypothetical protein